MKRLAYFLEWLYFGFWYWLGYYAMDLPNWVLKPKGEIMFRRPIMWIVQQGMVFAYWRTWDERNAG
jgi:hypothetical protein